VEAHGDVSDKEKMESVSKFNNNSDYRVFIGHPISLGVGINLVAASYCIYYSRNFSLEADIQSEARNYRGGSEIHDKITRIDIIAKDTLDELILQALENKMKISEELLKDWRNKL
jgi:SNF2 family DNA or RNA helicase